MNGLITKKYCIMMIILLVVLSISMEVWASSPVMSCTADAFTALGYKDEAFGKAITITSAAVVAATDTMPEYCYIQGTIYPAIGFEIKLPTATWNNRFQMTGCGGAGGSIPSSTVSSYVAQNYASAGTDTGHTGGTIDFTWANSQKDADSNQKIIDYGYRSFHEVTVLTKKVIKAYYGSAPTFSYYNGASCGGRAGMRDFQLYPDDFDGWVVGMPNMYRYGSAPGFLWTAQLGMLGDGALPASKLKLLADTVMAKCDALDGVTDGLIEDPRRCAWEPLKDLTACTNDVDADTCFTLAQRQSLSKIYGGIKTTKINIPELGFLAGSEMLAPSGTSIVSGWQGQIIPAPGAPYTIHQLFAMYVYKDLREMGDSFDWTASHDWDDDVLNSDWSKMEIIAADGKYDILKLKTMGKKVIMYHGWADALVRPLPSLDYYRKLIELYGSDTVKSFYKLYMVPGYSHGSGFGCSTVDWDGALRNWVENGVEPGALTGTRAASTVMGTAARTRPLCAYPQVTRYNGSGSIDDAANFTCVTPQAAQSATSGVTVTMETAIVPDKGVNGIPSTFSPTHAAAFTATGVSGSAQFTVDLGVLPDDSYFFMKNKKGSWQAIEKCTGLTDIKYESGILSYTMAESSDCNGSGTAGTISDSVAAGYYMAGYTAGSDYGDGGCFIATAAYRHPAMSILSAVILLALTVIGVGVGRFYRSRRTDI